MLINVFSVMIGDFDTDPGVHPHNEVPIFKVIYTSTLSFRPHWHVKPPGYGLIEECIAMPFYTLLCCVCHDTSVSRYQSKHNLLENVAELISE